MKPVPFWIHVCLMAGNGCLTTAYVMVMVAQGHAPQYAGLNAALGVTMLMAPHVARARRKAWPENKVETSPCVNFAVLGRHDGDPCASCELQSSSMFSRSKGHA